MELEITNKKQVKIYVYPENHSEDIKEITDFYWFEENGVHDWSGESAWSGNYHFKILVEG